MTTAPVRCICVTGPESTGKTTLARQVAELLRTEWVPEAARLYAERVGRELTVEDVEPIAREHIVMADAALLRARDDERSLIVLDTDLVSTMVYGRYYYDFDSAWLNTEAERRLATLYLLCEPDLAWVPDGIRDQPAAGQELVARFAELLQRLGANVRRVNGQDGLRLANARIALESL